MHNAPKTVISIATFAALLSASPAFAEPEPPAATATATPEVEYTPFFNVRAAYFSGFPELLGLFVEVRPMDRLRVEALGSFAPGVLSLGGRAKYALVSVGSGRNQLELAPAIGVRYLDNSELGAPEPGYTPRNHVGLGLEASAHLMYTLWFTPHFGLELQLAAGALARVGGGADDVVPVLGLSGGFAF